MNQASEIEEPDGEAAQLDVVTSFLAIILIYLMTVLMLTANLGEGAIESLYRREDPDAPLAILRSYQTIYPFQERWIIQHGSVARLDLSSIATAFAAASDGQTAFDYLDGTRLVVEPSSGGVTGFVLRIERPYKNASPAAGVGPFDIVMTLEEAIAATPQAFQSSAYFFVHPLETETAASFLGGLQKSGINPQIAVTGDRCDDRWCPSMRRDPDGFALEAIFR